MSNEKRSTPEPKIGRKGPYKTVEELIQDTISMVNLARIANEEKEKLRFEEEARKWEEYDEETNSLKASLEAQLEKAAEQVQRAKDATFNSHLQQELARGDFPMGFDNVSEEEKGPYYNEILSFLKPFMLRLMQTTVVPENRSGLDTVIELVKLHMKEHEEEKKKLMETMHVNRLIVPYISLDLPGDIILAYNKMEEDDPLVGVFRMHPLLGDEVYKFGIFLDRHDTVKEVLCSLVWSTIDNMVICLPMAGLNPYPVCWRCVKKFGVLTCGKCGVAKYCSKDCQVPDWQIHKRSCQKMEAHTKQHHYLTFS